MIMEQMVGHNRFNARIRDENLSFLAGKGKQISAGFCIQESSGGSVGQWAMPSFNLESSYTNGQCVLPFRLSKSTVVLYIISQVQDQGCSTYKSLHCTNDTFLPYKSISSTPVAATFSRLHYTRGASCDSFVSRFIRVHGPRANCEIWPPASVFNAWPDGVIGGLRRYHHSPHELVDIWRSWLLLEGCLGAAQECSLEKFIIVQCLYRVLQRNHNLFE